MNIDLLFAFLGGIGVVVGWGIADFLAKKSTDKIGYLATFFWSQFFGLLPIMLWVLISGASLALSPAVILIIGLFGVAEATNYLLFYRGLEHGKASVIGPLFSTSSALSVFVSVLLFKEAIYLWEWASFLLLFIGLFLISIDWEEMKNIVAKKVPVVKGVKETLVALVIFSFWIPLWDKFVSVEQLDIPPLMFWLRISMVAATGVFVFARFIAERNSAARQPLLKIHSQENLLWILCISLFDVLAYVSMTWAYGASSYTSVVTMVGSVYALPTVLLASVFLKERMSILQKIGVGIIFASVLLLGSFAV